MTSRSLLTPTPNAMRFTAGPPDLHSSVRTEKTAPAASSAMRITAGPPDLHSSVRTERSATGSAARAGAAPNGWWWLLLPLGLPDFLIGQLFVAAVRHRASLASFRSRK